MDQTPDSKPAAPPVQRVRILCAAATGAYLLLAAALLAWGAWKRFHIPQAPTADPDIRGYLGPALLALIGKKFAHVGGRSFPYPAFVFIVLRMFGDFRAISAVQHILGAAAGAVTLLAWNAALRLVPEGGMPRQLSRFIGLAPAAVYLGSATAIRFEQEIRPEAIFALFAILNLYLSFLFIDARFIRRHSSAIWIGGLNIFVAYLDYLLRPSFGFATFFSTLPVWLSLVLPGMRPGQKAALLALGILSTALLLYLPENLLKRDDAWSRDFVPETLFTIHASIILDQMSRDLAANNPTPWPRALVQSAHDLLQTDIQKGPAAGSLKSFPILGFDPTYLMYQSFCVEFPKMTGLDPAALDRFYLYYYRRAATREPGAMWHKIARQMGIFYCSKNPSFRLGQSMDLAADYEVTPGLIAREIPYGPKYPPLTPYLQQCTALAGASPTIDQPRWLTERTRFLSAHYLDLLCVAILSPLVLLFRPLRRHFLWAAAGLWLIYSYNFGNCLTVAIVHSLEVLRYNRIQLIYTVFAECFSIYFILEALTYGVRLLIARRTYSAASG